MEIRKVFDVPSGRNRALLEFRVYDVARDRSVAVRDVRVRGRKLHVNVIVSDESEGASDRIRDFFEDIEQLLEGRRLPPPEASAGVPWSKFLNSAVRHGLVGVTAAVVGFQGAKSLADSADRSTRSLTLLFILTVVVAVAATAYYQYASFRSRAYVAQFTESLSELEELRRPQVPDREQEAAQAALLIRRVTAEEDLERFRRASARYQVLGISALVLSFAGPIAAAWVLIGQRAAHYLAATAPLSLVPLAIGAALLRHDWKVRQQYQASAQETAFLDRLALAMDYARADPQREFVHSVRRDAISELIHARPLSTTHVQPANADDAGTPDLPALVDALLNAVSKKGAS